MGMDRDTLSAIAKLLRPLATRIANVVVRGTVQLANDAKKLQLLQLGALAGETVDNAESFSPYGFSSVPLAGAEHVTLFPNGDRSHPITLAVSDRRYRPTGGNPGEVTMYNNAGASMTMTKDGDIIAHAAPGRSFKVDDGSGATAIPTMADFNGLISIMSSCGAGASTALPLTLSNYQTAHLGWPFGTAVLKAK